jgi:hypothetical protein
MMSDILDRPSGDVLRPWPDLLRAQVFTTDPDRDPDQIERVVDTLQHGDELEQGGERVSRLLESLVGDTTLRNAIAYADAAYFLQVFTTRPEEGWAVNEARSGRIGESGPLGVDWTYQTTHDRGSTREARKVSEQFAPFLALPPTNRRISAHGFTMLASEDSRFVLHRYIDLAGLYAQLGLGLSWRLPIDDSYLDQDLLISSPEVD